MVDIPWGESTLRVPLPPGWRVLGPFAPTVPRPDAGPDELCRRALADPVGAAPLAARDLVGKRALLVVDDVSRQTPAHALLPPVFDALARAGVARRDVELLFALGVHRPMTQAEAAA